SPSRSQPRGRDPQPPPTNLHVSTLMASSNRSGEGNIATAARGRVTAPRFAVDLDFARKNATAHSADASAQSRSRLVPFVLRSPPSNIDLDQYSGGGFA